MYKYFILHSHKGFQFQEQQDEKHKILLRRERNRLAATNCRNKKKEKLSMILGKAEATEKSNNKLRLGQFTMMSKPIRLVIVNTNVQAAVEGFYAFSLF